MHQKRAIVYHHYKTLTELRRDLVPPDKTIWHKVAKDHGYEPLQVICDVTDESHRSGACQILECLSANKGASIAVLITDPSQLANQWDKWLSVSAAIANAGGVLQIVPRPPVLITADEIPITDFATSYDLTDFEWSVIKPLLPTGTLRRPPNDRRVLNGIFWVLGNGMPWSAMPKRYGNYFHCFRRFKSWNKIDLFDRISATVLEAGGGDALLKLWTSAPERRPRGYLERCE